MVDVQEYINREAPDIEARKLGLIDTAKALTEKGYTLPPNILAGLTPEQQRAFQLASSGIGGYEPFIAQAQGDITAGQAALGTGQATLQGALTGLAPTSAAAQATTQQAIDQLNQARGVAPTQAQLDSYMNPFQQSVIDTTMSELNKQGAQAQSQLASQAQQAGAFGGSRYGVQGAELEGNLQDARARALSQLNLQNYGQAQASAQNQLERDRMATMGIGALGAQQGGLGAQQAQLMGTLGTGIGQLGQGMANLGQGYASLGGQKQAMAGQDVQNLLGIGGMQQQFAQQQADIARQNQLQGIMQPYQQLGFYGDILQGAPSSQQMINTSQTPPISPLQAGIGTGIGAIAGIGGLRKLGVI
jgi:hypothetical protein|tara:strand:+ start:106 stop:1185 length:1080 start_codon:yes stop_codon:yes gene_type:complete